MTQFKPKTLPHWIKALKYRLPLVGRLRRQRDSARQERRQLTEQLDRLRASDESHLADYEGLKLLLDRQSLVDRAVAGWKDGWERPQIAFMCQAAQAMAGDPRPKIFLDIGAYWGLYALSMRSLGLFDAIHCFEPEPHNFAQLGAQLFLNKASYDITAHNLAVLDRCGEAQILPSLERPDNRGNCPLAGEGETGRPVKVIALDDLFLQRDCLFFIKIDIEGSEGPALKGMQRLLATNEVYLQVEAFPEHEAQLPRHVPPHLTKRAQFHWDHVYATFAWPGPVPVTPSPARAAAGRSSYPAS